MQLVKCVSACLLACAPVHNVQAERRGEEEPLPGLLSGVTGAERMCACSCLFQNYISQRKCPQLTHFSINECVHQIPRITTNPEHRLIPQCNVSRLNVKMWSFTFNAIREQLLFKLQICDIWTPILQAAEGQQRSKKQHHVAQKPWMVVGSISISLCYT